MGSTDQVTLKFPNGERLRRSFRRRASAVLDSLVRSLSGRFEHATDGSLPTNANPEASGTTSVDQWGVNPRDQGRLWDGEPEHRVRHLSDRRGGIPLLTIRHRRRSLSPSSREAIGGVSDFGVAGSASKEPTSPSERGQCSNGSAEGEPLGRLVLDTAPAESQPHRERCRMRRRRPRRRKLFVAPPKIPFEAVTNNKGVIRNNG